MLKHLRDHQEYWFCRHCWSEMPDFEHSAALNSESNRQRSSSIIVRKPSLVGKKLATVLDR